MQSTNTILLSRFIVIRSAKIARYSLGESGFCFFCLLNMFPFPRTANETQLGEERRGRERGKEERNRANANVATNQKRNSWAETKGNRVNGVVTIRKDWNRVINATEDYSSLFSWLHFQPDMHPCFEDTIIRIYSLFLLWSAFDASPPNPETLWYRETRLKCFSILLRLIQWLFHCSIRVSMHV